MMMRVSTAFILCVTLLLSSCSPVKTAEINQYQLTRFSEKKIAKTIPIRTLQVTPTEAASGYQSKQMLYATKPYEINAFAKNAWASSPADMLFPLIIQSMQHSGYFQAVLSSPSEETTDYRLDTQLIALEQNFLQKPSAIHLTVKAVLTDLKKGQIIASRLLTQKIPCPYDTPYGGVIAANQATRQLTVELLHFVATKL